jgi:aryl-alcohol dehydrogenase-like predicted oxidoreductase
MAPKRHTVKLGKDGPQVTALGFGAMGLSAYYGAIGSDEERLEFLDHVYESGELNWDSADVYGDNEDLIGKWFKRSGKRADIFLATKFASTTDEQGRRIVRSDPEYCKQACAKSLKRLGIDQIDLYYCHRVDGKTPIEKTVRSITFNSMSGSRLTPKQVQAMAELKQYVSSHVILPLLTTLCVGKARSST